MIIDSRYGHVADEIVVGLVRPRIRGYTSTSGVVVSYLDRSQLARMVSNLQRPGVKADWEDQERLIEHSQ